MTWVHQADGFAYWICETCGWIKPEWKQVPKDEPILGGQQRAYDSGYKSGYQDGYYAGREHVLDLLREVSKQGIESDLKGVDYLTVQIDRKLWNAIREEIEQ
jgi:hypothetical protein